MKTIALAFVGLVLFAQEPKPKPPTVEELQAQVAQLQQQVAQKDQQIAAMQANIDASQDMVSRCYQGLVDLHAKLPPKR